MFVSLDKSACTSEPIADAEGGVNKFKIEFGSERTDAASESEAGADTCVREGIEFQVHVQRVLLPVKIIV